MSAPDGTPLPRYTHDAEGRALIGPSDFAPDGHGGVYFTTSGNRTPPYDSNVFHLSGGIIRRVAADFHNANGLAVSRDGKSLYVIETDAGHVLVFAVGADGRLPDRRVFLDLNALTHHVAPIFPDGMKIDSKGFIYIGQSPRDPRALLRGRIFVVDRRGRLIRHLQLPSPGVPKLGFSPDEKTVYVTAVDQLDQPPYLGKVYSVPNR